MEGSDLESTWPRERVASDTSLPLLSGDEDATTRLNAWLNGGGSSVGGPFLELGVTTNRTTRSVEPFADAASLPSPFEIPRSRFSVSAATAPMQMAVEAIQAEAPTLPSANHSLSLPSLHVPIPLEVAPSATVGILRHRQEGSDTPSNPPKAATVALESIDDVGKGALHTHGVPKPPPVPVPSKLQHQRTVSWGDPKTAHTTKANGKPPPANLSPKLDPAHGRSPSGDSMFSFLTQTDYAPSPRVSYTSRKSAGQASSTNGAKSVSLQDIVRTNPLESEAETLILMAIEKQDTATRARANTGGSTLLENIPDASVHVFLPTVDVPSSANNTSGSIRSVASPDVANTETPIATNGRPRSSTIESSQASPLVPDKDKKSNATTNRVLLQRPPRPIQKRNVTMADTLATLTEAMAGYHELEAEYAHTSTHPLDDNAAGWATPSAGETLAKNANLLFRGQQKTEGKSAPAQPDLKVDDSMSSNQSQLKHRRASHNWKKLQASVAVGDHQPTLAETSCTNPAMLSSSLPSVESHKKNDSLSLDHSADGADDIECGVVPPGNEEPNPTESPSSPSGSSGRRKHPHRTTMLNPSKVGLFKDFRTFVRQRRPSFITYLRFLFLVAIPAMTVSVVLFYFAGNPPVGKADLSKSKGDVFVRENGEIIDPEIASASWWIIFICIRQAITFSLAQLLQVFIVDFLCLNTRFFVNIFGNLVTLLIVQSRGWPFIALMWSVLDLALLFGTSRFAAHWLYWQRFADVLNDSNPAGDVTNNIWNRRALLIAFSVGIVVSLKRLWLGLYLGRKTFANYAEDLTKLVTRMLTLCEVAALARDIGTESSRPDSIRRVTSVSQFGMTREDFDGMLRYSEDEDSVGTESIQRKSAPSTCGENFLIDPKTVAPRGGTLDSSHRAKINELLGAWEEPEVGLRAEEQVSIGGILQFRNSLAFLGNSYMFSIAWGDVSSRERMVFSSQEVYRKLLQHSSDPNLLKFDVLARVAELPDGSLDHEKLKRLIRLLRPERDGSLSLLDFVKSVDSVYKEAKLLQASVVNSEKIDRAFEKAFNIPFFTVVVCVVLGRMGFDPLALFLSLSSLILGFAFMIGTASSKMFEGWLFILVRRPYNIGDRIHISNIESDTSPDGSWAWIVKDLTLFHTTAVFAATGENATMSNGSLASSRIINMARSPKATVYIYLKFATNVPYERIEIFETALREFVKSRPREWANFSGFRATQVMAELNYIEYVVVLIHREAWQNVVSILESKAKVASFCLELSKKLDMRYQSPPLPVDLALVNRGAAPTDGQSIASKLAGFANEDSSGYRELVAMFDKK